MNTSRIVILAAAIISVAAFSGCHELGPLPPGQIKNVIVPPPGHGGIPPGQLKKY